MDDHSCSIHLYHAAEKACLTSSASPFNRRHHSQQQHRAVSPNNFNGTRPSGGGKQLKVLEMRANNRQIWDVNFVVFYYTLAYKNVTTLSCSLSSFLILIYSNKLSVCLFFLP